MADGGRYGHNSGADEAVQALLADAMDVRVARWHDGPKGATVTFDLHEDDVAKNGGVNPFKGREGKRFKLLLWEVADDETPLPPAASSRPRDAAPPGKPDLDRSRRSREAYQNQTEEERAVADAAIFCQDKAHQREMERQHLSLWHQHCEGDATPQDVMSHCLCDILRVTRKRDLVSNGEARAAFYAIREEFERAAGRIP